MTTHPLMASIERLRAAQTRLQGIAAELADIREDPDARHAGTDPDGAVELTIDSHGAPLSVRVSANWQSTVGPAGLGPAVLAARTAAVTARLETWSAAADEADERRATGEVAPTPETSADAGPDVDPGPELSTEELATVLPAALAERDRYIAALDDLQATVAKVRSPDGNVIVGVRGRSPVSVELDEKWLRFAAPHSIGHSTRAALQAAHDHPDSIRDRLATDFPAIAALRGNTPT